MKLLNNILLFLLLPVFADAQQNSFYEQEQKKQLDSLQLTLKNATNDTLRMDLYKKLSRHYEYEEIKIKRDSSRYFTQLQLLISQKLKLKLWEADALSHIGFLLNTSDNYPEALQSLLKSLKIAEDRESEKNHWGLINQYETPEKSRLNMLALTHFYLGQVYRHTDNNNQQLFHFRESEKFALEVNDVELLTRINWLLGNLYNNLNKPDSALVLEFRALDFNSQSNSKRNRARIYNTIGNIYLKKANYTLAKQSFYEVLKESKENYTPPLFARTCLSISRLFIQEGNKDSSLWYAKKGLEIFQLTGALSGLENAYTTHAAVYKLRNNIDSAFKYQGLAIAAKDSLNNAGKITQFQNIGFDEQLRQKKLEDEKIQFQNKIRTYALIGGIAFFMLTAFLLFRNNRNRKKANTQLQKQKADLQTTLSDLKNTQAQLIQSEKMASLGELTAGIAHEIQNPLNFVNNFSEVNKELIAEMREEIKKGNYDEVNALAKDVEENEEKINHHGKRADAIVKGMLQHSQSSSGVKEPTDINALADEYLRLVYHGLRARDKSFNATMKTDFDEGIGNINIIPQDIGRVILNLITNAFYAVNEKNLSAVATLPTGQAGPTAVKYEPTVSISTKKVEGKVEIKVADNGNGIPQKILDKIFQPFFTTKPTGQGTGLGLSLAYDIVKAHGGELKVETNEGEARPDDQVGRGSEFIISLPV